MVYWQDEWQSAPYQKKAIDKKNNLNNKKLGKIFLQPIFVGMVGSYNCIGTILNGYTQRN